MEVAHRPSNTGVPGPSAARRTILDLRGGWLVILAFFVQMATIFVVTDPTALGLKRAVFAVTSVMLLLGVLPNLRWWAFRVLALGLFLNIVVMAANGGLMPVTPENLRLVPGVQAETVQLGQTPPQSKNVLLEPSETRLGFLSDVIFLSVPRPKVYSIGDLLLFAGVAVFLVEIGARAVQSRRRSRRTGEFWRRKDIE